MVDFDTQLERNEYAARETAKAKEHLSSLLKEAYNSVV